MTKPSPTRAITTRYKGYAFRSRLEARFAVFLDHLKVRWEYEPEGFELGNGLRYLPDFWLPDFDMWVEIKPGPMEHTAREKATRLAHATGKPVFVTEGLPDRNGVLFFQDMSHTVIELPAYFYFQAAPGLALAFGENPRPEHRCRKIEVRGMPYDPARAAEGVALRGTPSLFQDALFAARAARFEFNSKGAK